MIRIPSEYSAEEFNRFTKVEQKIIILIKNYGIDSPDKVREILGFPLEPMPKSTYRGHMARIQQKISKIRLERVK